ncbi:MAG: hypothetical protein KBA06_03610 [Saprospiraceae bacterium]|nr:hypothetical protein [Saprospiraceae bacterium]
MKLINLKNISLFFISILCSFGHLYAQKELPAEQLEVIKDFDLQLLESEKINLTPILPEIKSDKSKLDYNINAKQLKIDYDAPQIKPMALPKEKEIKEAYKGVAKIGYGNPNQIVGDVIYQSNVSDNLMFGGRVSHHSLNNSKKILHQRSSETNVNLNGTYYFPQGFATSAELGVERNRFGLYGFDNTDTTYLKKDSIRALNDLNFGLSFFNGPRTKGDINYGVKMFVYNRKDKTNDASENGFLIKSEVAKYFNKKHPLALNIGADLTKFKDTATQKLNHFFIEPSFTWHGDMFSAKVGVNFINQNSTFHIFPNVEAVAMIAGNKFQIFAGAEGNAYKNSFRNLSDYNPYVAYRPDSLKYSFYNQYYGGLKGRVSFLDYRAQVSYKKVNDLAMFLQDETDSRYFKPIFDTVSIITVQGSLTFFVLKDLDLKATLSNNIYTPKNEKSAWGLPTFESDFRATYHLMEEKLLINGNMMIATGVSYKAADDSKKLTTSLFDISLGAEYWFIKNIGAYIQFNNLLSNKNERWLGYPRYGLNILGGVVAKF